MQNHMLGKLNTDIDKSQMKMMKVDSKLKLIVAKSNTCKLWVIIFIEIALLIILIIA
jgi:hypothetical protein